jgi:hypothetical protein
MSRCLIARSAFWFAFRRGDQYGWSYNDTMQLAENLYSLLNTKLIEGDSSEAVSLFRATMMRLHNRVVDPFGACGMICKQPGNVCLYRYAVSDLVSDSPAVNTIWNDITVPSNENWVSDANKLCLEVASRVLDIGDLKEANEAPKRIGLCFAQQKLITYPTNIRQEKLISLINHMNTT